MLFRKDRREKEKQMSLVKEYTVASNCSPLGMFLVKKTNNSLKLFKINFESRYFESEKVKISFNIETQESVM